MKELTKVKAEMNELKQKINRTNTWNNNSFH